MDIISTIPDLRTRLAKQGRIAFVPTMGNLHAGHISLINLARQRGDCVVASIFVNPLQFAPNEDLASYPRTLQADCEKLQIIGCDVVFTPDEATLYPQPQDVRIALPQIADQLSGAVRPGHFHGVATVVLKLFNIVQPQVAVFGQKDFQQLHIIRHMVEQLALPIEIVAGETVREADGLAMSSRNSYLKPAERSEAPRLYKALQQVTQTVQNGSCDFITIETQTTQYLTQLGWQVDYIAIRDAQTLSTPSGDSLVVLGAARLGSTRLIDNILIPRL